MSQNENFNFNGSFQMMILLLLGMIASVSAHAFVELENRSAIEMEGGLLSPFWAQEYVGADLVKEDMRMQSDLPKIPVAIYDLGFEEKYILLTTKIQVDKAMNGNRPTKGHHGTSVANIINGPGMMSISEVVQYVQLSKVSPAFFYFPVFRDMLALPVRPQIISNSMGWRSPDVKDLAIEADQLGIIWVMASGNEHPTPIEEHERTAPVISVGSYSPRGLQTRSSQESDQLDILAPGDEYEASIDGNGEPILFGGTSGATPLVSGALANVKTLLPSLTRAQAEVLLKKSAFRSLHQYYSATNKAGLLNAYKMYHAAVRIKEICSNDTDCINRELHSKKNYLFASEPLPQNIRTVCATQEKLDKQDMQILRRQTFLAQNPATYAKILSCAYRNEGFSINADYYENLSLIYTNPPRLQGKIRKDAVTAVEQGYLESAALRDLELLDENFRAALLKAIKTNSGIGQLQASEYLKAYEATSRINLEKQSPNSGNAKAGLRFF